MKIRGRVNRLETILEKEIRPKFDPIFIWADGEEEAEKEMCKLSQDEKNRAIIIGWDLDRPLKERKGPIGPL